MRSRRLLSGCLAGVVGFSFSARADTYYYRNTLMGDRAAGMGGAFTAISDDPSGAIYNPAGLCLSPDNYFSLSVNAYQTGSETYKNVFTGKDYSYHSQSLMPSMFGFTSSLGQGKKIAFTIFVKDYRIIDQNDTLTEISNVTNRTYGVSRQLAYETATYLLGPSYSMQMSPRFSLGASLFATFFHFRTVDIQYQTFNPVGSGRYAFQNVYLNRSNFSLWPRAGVLFALTPKLSLGASIAKAFYVSSDGKIRVTSTQYDSNGLPVVLDGSQDNDVKARAADGLTLRLVAPYEFAFGAAYFLSDKTTISADAILYTKDSSFTEYKSAFTVNWSVGAETYVAERIPVRLGVYSNNPHLSKLVEGGHDQLPYVPLVGIAGGVTFLSPSSSVTMTTTYAFGSGKGQVVAGTTAQQDVSKAQLTFLVSGSYQM